MTFFRLPPPMKMALVATMNSYSEFIVGFSHLVKSPRQTQSGLSWLPDPHFITLEHVWSLLVARRIAAGSTL